MRNVLLLAIVIGLLATFGPVAHAQDGTPIPDYLALGNAAFADGEYELALLFFNRALDFNPRSIEAIEGRAQTHYLLADYAAAVNDYTLLIELGVASIVTYYNRGLAHSAQATWAESDADLSRVIAAGDGLAPEAYVARGRNAFAQDNVDVALSDFNEAIRLRPDFAPAFFERGRVLMAQADVEAAFASFDRAIALDVRYAAAYHTRGLLFFQLEDYEAAIDDFDRTLALDERFPNAYFNRANAYFALADYETALDDYYAAYDVGGSVDGLLGAARVWLLIYEDAQAAIDLLNIAHLTAPERADVLAQRGLAFLTLGEFEYARSDLDLALEFDPEFVAAYVHRANTRLSQDDARGALADFDQALLLEPENLDALVGRGYVYLSLGQIEAALGDFSSYAELAGTAADEDVLALIATLSEQ